MSDLLNYVNDETLEDQTEFTGGNFERELPKEGKHPARLVSYIEIGKFASEYEGKAKAPADNVILVFELLGKDDVRTTDDGRTFANRMTLTLTKSFHEKSGYRKLFELMRNGDSNIKHMSQMLMTKAWLIGIEHNKSKDGNKTYANMKNKERGWLVYPAIREVFDEDGSVSETVKINVREAVSEPQLLLWDNPKAIMWNSIYIDGTYTRKDKDGNETEVSKNWIQERCMEAVNFEGSALQDMIAGLGEVAEEHQEDAKQVDTKKTKKASEKAPEASDEGDDDDLAALGL